MRSEFWLLAMLVEALLSWAVLVWRERVHDRERQDLLDRLMARDYNQYREGQEENSSGAVRNWLRGKSEKVRTGDKERAQVDE